MIRLLLIEDDHADQLIFERNIKKCGIDYSFNIKVTISSGIEELEQNEYDIVFCDFNLPDGTAIELLSKQDKDNKTPVIVLTSQGDIEKATESLKTGAFDYITKDNVNAPSLERIINNILRIQGENQVRKELEKRLEENNANTRAILDNTTDGIWSLDNSGKLLIFNKIASENFEHHLNYTPQVGDSFFDQLTTEYLELFNPLFKQALIGNSKITVHEIIEEDSSFFLEVACSPIVNQDEVTGVTFFARSVTKRVEDEKKIREAKLLAEQALEFKSQFLANMSHEIRTPMNAMLGFTDLLDKTALDSEQKDFVDIIRNSGEDLLVIINDILDLSKIQTGKMDLRKVDFNLAITLKNVIRLHRYKAEDKGNILNLILDKKLPKWLLGDDLRLTQILNNLISNAIKFTENGTVSLEVKKVKEDKEKVSLQFIVSDSGIGIPKDKLSDIFEDFTQVESNLQREAQGTGLGLAIVSNLVHLMEGSIEVNSELNEGSNFGVTIVFEHGAEVIESESSVDNNDKSLAGLKILICDDIELNRILVSKTLKPYNTKLFFAENGQVAIDIARSEDLDIIFMDIQMPKMNGYEATKVIRTFSDVPIIAMTSHLLNEEQQKCSGSGMNGFVPKPFKEKDLLNHLSHLQTTKISEESGAKDKWAELKMPTLVSLADGDEGFAISLFDSFLSLVNTRLEQYKNALESNDLKEIQSIAHMFRSSFITFDLLDLNNLADKIANKNMTQEDLENFLTMLEKARLQIMEKKESFS